MLPKFSVNINKYEVITYNEPWRTTVLITPQQHQRKEIIHWGYAHKQNSPHSSRTSASKSLRYSPYGTTNTISHPQTRRLRSSYLRTRSSYAHTTTHSTTSKASATSSPTHSTRSLKPPATYRYLIRCSRSLISGPHLEFSATHSFLSSKKSSNLNWKW